MRSAKSSVLLTTSFVLLATTAAIGRDRQTFMARMEGLKADTLVAWAKALTT